MSENEATSNVREEFSKLSLDGKTSFLVEAVFSTAGTAIQEIGDRLGNLVDLVTSSLQSAADDAARGEKTSESPESPTGEAKAGDDESRTSE